MIRYRPTLAALSLVAGAVSCNSGDGGVANVLVVASVEVAPGISDVVLGTTKQLSATPKTSSGITVPGRSVTWSSTEPLVASVSNSGLVTGLAVGGPVRIRATVDGVTGDALISVRPVPIDHITVDPSARSILVNGSVLLKATARDASGAELPGRSFNWQSSASNIAAVTSDGLVLGIAEGGPVTISASAEGKTGTSAISVSTRPATRLAFIQQPGAGIAGQAMSPPIRIALQDDFLTTVLGATNPVTIQLAGNPGGATLSGTTTRSAVNGVATFDDLVLDRVGNSYTFQVTSPGLTGATSSPFNVAAGSASRLSFATAPPPGAQSGVALSPQPVLQLRDAAGNAVAQAGVVITASLASGPGTLGGTTTATTNGAGLASFSNLTLTGPAGSYTLSFAASGVTPLVSGTITLGSGQPASLFIATQPSSSAQSGVPLSQQPAIQLRDQAGNNVAQSGVVITASVASGGGSLGGSTTATTNSNGLAQFASLALNGSAGSYTLGFSSPGLNGATSTPIVLGAGGPTGLSITTQPSAAATSGAAFGQQPAIQLRDGSGNPATIAGITVTASITGGSGSLVGSTTATTNGSGLATFSGLGISGPVGSYTLTFTAPGLASVVSSTIALSAGAATKLVMTTQPPASASSGVPLSPAPVVQIQDAAGNPVALTRMVTATLASGPGGVLTGTTTVTTNSFGAATFSNLSIVGASGTYTIQFASSGLTSVTSSSVTLGAGAPTQLAVATQPSSTVQSGVAFPTQPAIQLRDASNNPVAQSGVVVTAAIASGGGTLGGTTTATTNSSGLATFTNLSISGTIGTRTLSFSASGLTGTTSGSISVTAGPAHHLDITTQPSSTANAGVPFPSQPVVQLLDASNNPVSQGSTLITASIISGPSGASLTNATATTGSNGAATFSGLTLTGPTGSYTIGFSSGSLIGAISNSITLAAGVANKLVITTQPSASVYSGVVFPQQPVVQIVDVAGNPVPQSGAAKQVTVSLQGGGTLGGTLTVAENAGGTVAFTDLRITGPLGNYSLLFASAGLVSVQSATIAVVAGPPTQLVLTQQPVAGTSGSALTTQPIVALRDAQGNTVTSDNTTQVSVAISSGTGGSLGGTLTVTAVNGVATFTNVTLTGTAGQSYVLQFTSNPALTPVSSNSVTVSAGTPTNLAITTQPVGGASGAALATQPVVAIRDAGNNLITTDNSTQVTVAILSGSGGTLGGTLTVTAVNGVATFTNVTLAGTVGVNYVLQFTSNPALTPASSGNVNVSAGAPTRLGIVTQPVGGASGAALSTQPAVAIQDAQGNTVTSDNSTQVTAAILSGAGGTLGGTQTVTAVNGIATFTNLTLAGTVGVSYVLQFTSNPALTPASSNAITVTAGAASALTITTQPVGGASGGLLATQPVVAIRDAQGNAVTSDNTTQITVAIFSGSFGTLGGTLTVTAVNGVGTFTNVTLSGTVGVNYVLQFTASPALTPVNSGNVTVSPGGATKLDISTQPVGGASGGLLATQPVIAIRTAANDLVTTDNSTQVTVAIFSGAGGTLGGTLTVTAVNGVATFTNLTLAGTVGVNYVLRFTSNPALTPVNSTDVTVTAGVATQLVLTRDPGGAPSGAPLNPQPQLTIRDAQGNTVLTDNSTQVTASILNGPVGVLSGTLTVTAINGVVTYTNLVITGLPGDYRLKFTSQFAPINSNKVTITP